VAIAMIIVQALDSLVGISRRKTLLVARPAAIALANLPALAWFINAL